MKHDIPWHMLTTASVSLHKSRRLLTGIGHVISQQYVVHVCWVRQLVLLRDFSFNRVQGFHSRGVLWPQ
jgi:hypothetical protein